MRGLAVFKFCFNYRVYTFAEVFIRLGYKMFNDLPTGKTNMYSVL